MSKSTRTWLYCDKYISGYMSRASQDLALAGFVDDNGNLGRQVPSGKVIVPGEVWLEGNAIRWRIGKTARLRVVSRNMLNQFVRLTDSESIRRFANKWGVLALSND